MFFVLKFFDRSVWIKRISFLGKTHIFGNVSFENFGLDTRYTFNLLILTIIVSLVGFLSYIVLSIIIGNKEVFSFYRLIRFRLFSLRLGGLKKVDIVKDESVSIPSDQGLV